MFDVKYITQTKTTSQKRAENSDESEKNNKKKNKQEVKVEIPVVFAKDTEELACLVMKERNLDPGNTTVQVGIDDGQGLLKVMMSLKESSLGEESVSKKKSKYSEGFAPNDFKLSSVKKLILLLVSPTTESHHNLSSLLGLLKLDAVEFGYCCDLKMILILLGKQSASSKYCCPFCTGSSPWLDTYTVITIGSLWSDYTAYIASGSKKSKAQQFHNVINPPLITGLDGWSEDPRGLVFSS